MSQLRATRLVLLLSFVSSFGRASVIEPNGLQVPINSNNGEVPLKTFFAQRGEGFDWLNDAHTQPAVFSPLCGFTATFVLNQAGSHFGLAWYNVDPNAVQPPNQLFVLIPANSAVGTTAKSADIKNSPNYKGGLIGFALVGGQTHYSEQKWNVTCNFCKMPGPWALAVIYQSTKIPDAYYLAFEDGDVTGTSFNNDGDFNDDVFLVTGVLCNGGGMTCDTGKPGICKDGLTECNGMGGVGCKQLNQNATETCDGLDNDCNGMVDDGAMCPMGQVCDRGRCVEMCGAAEFGCGGGFVCDNGVCVEQGCVGLKCPAGQVCHDGKCAGACDGVVCPHGDVCRVGRCVDPCAGVTCPMNQVCEGGVCIAACSCQPCAAKLACDMPTGHCVDPACANVKCGAGTYCKSGLCVDLCDGVVCPVGQMCIQHECVTPPPVDMAMDDLAESMPGDDGSADEGDGGGGSGKHKAGCACDLGRRAGAHHSALFLTFALLGSVLVRRRMTRRTTGRTTRRA